MAGEVKISSRASFLMSLRSPSRLNLFLFTKKRIMFRMPSTIIINMYKDNIFSGMRLPITAPKKFECA